MRQTLYQQLRKRFSLNENQTKTFLTKEEMIQIVTQIYGKEQPWTTNINYMTDYLLQKGWTKQATTDSHPSRENLNWLIKVPLATQTEKKVTRKPKKTKITLHQVLAGIDPKLMQKAKGISINNEATRVTLQF